MKPRYYVDPKLPGVIRLRDGADSCDGILAGTRAAKICNDLNFTETGQQAIHQLRNIEQIAAMVLSDERVGMTALKTALSQIKQISRQVLYEANHS